MCLFYFLELSDLVIINGVFCSLFYPSRVLITVLLMSCFNSVPGVPRETETEKDFADFDIFDDPETPFSTFNFQYSNEAFTRLHDLMEFNTLNNLEVCSP